MDSIEIKNKRIVHLEIMNAKTGVMCFKWDAASTQPTTAPTTNPVCDMCGEVIKGYTGKNGKPVSVGRHCAASLDKYERVLCLDCIRLLTPESDAQ